MKIKVRLEKQLPLEIIGTNVNIKDTIIGVVTKYDKETGMATFNINDGDLYSKIGLDLFSGHNIEISSKKVNSENTSKWICKDCNGTFMGENITCKCIS